MRSPLKLEFSPPEYARILKGLNSRQRKTLKQWLQAILDKEEERPSPRRDPGSALQPPAGRRLGAPDPKH